MPHSATKASSGNPLPAGFYGRYGKRVLDFTVALLSLVCLIPLFAILAVLLVVIQRTPPFFLQKRIGRGLKPFYIIKFKTMKDTRDAEGRLLPDEQRTTLLGSLLRRTSLDELPELVNVLLGDMSFIGPRPWIPEQMAIFTPSTRKKEWPCTRASRDWPKSTAATTSPSASGCATTSATSATSPSGMT